MNSMWKVVWVPHCVSLPEMSLSNTIVFCLFFAGFSSLMPQLLGCLVGICFVRGYGGGGGGCSLDRVLLAIALVGRTHYIVDQAADELSVMPLLVSVGGTVYTTLPTCMHILYLKCVCICRWLFLSPAFH